MNELGAIAAVLKSRHDVAQALYGPGRINKWADDRFSIDAPLGKFDSEIAHEIVFDVNRKAMSVTLPVSVEVEDRSRDVVMVKGIWTKNHEKNPVVLLDHGMYFKLPIGKAVTPNGTYTFVAGKKVATATTHFSQKLLEAEQVFQLYDEGVMRGASISFKARRARPMPMSDDSLNQYQGVCIEECELLEYSHAVIPDNQECVTGEKRKSWQEAVADVLGRNKLAGRPIAEPIFKSLSMFAPERRIWANGWTPPVETKAMDSAMNETRTQDGAAVVEDDEVAAREDDNMLPGAKALKEEHGDLMMRLESIKGRCKKQENKDVVSHFDKKAAAIEEDIKGVCDLHHKLYPEYERLESGKDDEAADEAHVDQADETDAAGQPDKQKSIAAKQTKRLDAWKAKQAAFAKKYLPKSCYGIIKDAGDDMEDMADAADEHMGDDADPKKAKKFLKSMRTRCKYHCSQLRTIKNDETNQPGPQGEAQIKSLQAELEAERAKNAELAKKVDRVVASTKSLHEQLEKAKNGQ